MWLNLLYIFIGTLRPWPRQPDLIIKRYDGSKYMSRWWILPRNPFFNVYLHHFFASDDDRALHDHPWWNMSVLLTGSYYEIVPKDKGAWEARANRETISILRKKGQIVTRPARAIHRVELMKRGTFQTLEIPVWTLFITGRKIREWGFWCKKDWLVHTEYNKKVSGESQVGRGCD